MGEAAFLHATFPQGAAIVFLSLLLLRSFKFFVHFLSGFGVLSVVTPMFGYEWNSTTATVALISFLVGAAVSKYFSEENPPYFVFLVVLGIGMIVLNWGIINDLMGVGVGRLVGSVASILPF